MKSVMKERGFTLMEMVTVIAIVAIILTAIVWPSYNRFVASSNVKSGIQHLLTLKATMERYAQACRGFPERASTDGVTNLYAFVYLNTDANPTVKPWGTPRIYPGGNECDVTSLRLLMRDLPPDPQTNPTAHGQRWPACEATDAACTSSRETSWFNALFVKYGSGPCAQSSGGTDPGWNYALITGQYPSGTGMPVSVPVYCANVLGPESSVVTVVMNGAGVTESGTPIADGSGMIGPNGTPLATGCPCGAWCQKTSLTGGTNLVGCCAACTDKAGTSHTGLGFNY